MSRLRSHKTNIVPPMPIKATVQPNVQVSIFQIVFVIVLVFVNSSDQTLLDGLRGPARPRVTSTKKLIDLSQGLLGLHRLSG
jgi:hypothetical protein